MGMISAARCNACHGTGEVITIHMDEAVLYEWIEGYLDKDTPDEWLIKIFKKLMKERKQRFED